MRYINRRSLRFLLPLRVPYGLSTLATIVAEFGDYSRRIRRLTPKTATVAEFGDKLSPKSAAIFSSVDRALVDLV